MDRDDQIKPLDSQEPDTSSQSEELPEQDEDRATSFARRAILQAGWTVPVIMTVAAPRAFAQSPHGDHADHNDHADGHTDHSDHVDSGGGGQLGHSDAHFQR